MLPEIGSPRKPPDLAWKINMDTLFELASLTDTEANHCLNRVLSGIKEAHPEIPLTSPEDLGSILQGAAIAMSAEYFKPKIDAKLIDGAKAVRMVLLEFLGDPELKARVEAALASDRHLLVVDPITQALIMAGIVVVLKTNFKMTFKRDKNKKSEFQVSIETKPSSEGIIKRFFSFFGR
jgi:hypothetical protein